MPTIGETMRQFAEDEGIEDSIAKLEDWHNAIEEMTEVCLGTPSQLGPLLHINAVVQGILSAQLERRDKWRTFISRRIPGQSSSRSASRTATSRARSSWSARSSIFVLRIRELLSCRWRGGRVWG